MKWMIIFPTKWGTNKVIVEHQPVYLQCFYAGWCVIVACSIHCSAAVVVACREAFQFRCDGVWTWVSRCIPVARDPRTRAVWTCPEQQGGTLKIFCCCFSPYLRKMDPFWLRFFNASGLKPSSRKNFCISRMAILVSICCILRVVFCNKVLFTRSSPKNFDEGTGKGCCSPDMLRI